MRWPDEWVTRPAHPCSEQCGAQAWAFEGLPLQLTGQRDPGAVPVHPGYFPLLREALLAPHRFTLLGLQRQAGQDEPAVVKLMSMNLPGCPHAYVQQAHHLAGQFLAFPEYDPDRDEVTLTWRLEQVLLVAQIEDHQPHLHGMHRMDVEMDLPAPRVEERHLN